MLERQREGIAKAKGEDKYYGPSPTARAKTADVCRLEKEGKLTREGIRMGWRRRYRVLSALSAAGAPQSVSASPSGLRPVCAGRLVA
jgi:hypothetical protein